MTPPRLLSLHREDWPAADRIAWDAALAPVDSLFDDQGGAAERFSVAAMRKFADAYAQWLSFLDRTGDLDPHQAPSLKLGVKGIFDAQTLIDIAKNTRRGEEARVRLGRSFGRPAYGYRMIRRLRPDGEPDRGLREPDPATAPVVRRIFEAYCAGHSPRAIARQLNAEGIPGPDGIPWNDATIRGRPKRGDGILRNPIYVGRLVWGRHKKLREPVVGRKVLRMADPIRRCGIAGCSRTSSTCPPSLPWWICTWRGV